MDDEGTLHSVPFETRTASIGNIPEEYRKAAITYNDMLDKYEGKELSPEQLKECRVIKAKFSAIEDIALREGFVRPGCLHPYISEDETEASPCSVCRDLKKTLRNSLSPSKDSSTGILGKGLARLMGKK